MVSSASPAPSLAGKTARFLALSFIAALALASATTTLLAAVKVIPWLQITASWNGLALPWAGMALQIGVTLLTAALLFYLPAHARIMRLERSHRDFRLSMEDVAHAYRESHAADRRGLFSLSSEFDSIRERLRHLRDHPDLGMLEPEVLELAAQMSHSSRELARIYSDDKMARARTFLTQRQQEVEAFQENLALAQRTCDELKRWVQDVSVEEQVAEAQLDALERDLAALLPALGYEMHQPAPRPDAKVVSLPHKPGE